MLLSQHRYVYLYMFRISLMLGQSFWLVVLWDTHNINFIKVVVFCANIIYFCLLPFPFFGSFFSEPPQYPGFQCPTFPYLLQVASLARQDGKLPHWCWFTVGFDALWHPLSCKYNVLYLTLIHACCHDANEMLIICYHKSCPNLISRHPYNVPVTLRLFHPLASQACCMISLTVIIDGPDWQDVHHTRYHTLPCVMCLDWSITQSSHMKVSKSFFLYIMHWRHRLSDSWGWTDTVTEYQ